MASTIIADQRRALKASKLVAVLAQAGATAENVPHLRDDGWRAAADAADVPAPSPATRTLVAQWFAEREQPVADPFADLDDLQAVAR